MPGPPEGFDLEALLAPIPGDAPQGTDIREDFSASAPYNRLRDARSEARDAERGQDAAGADQEVRDPAPHWRAVRELALKTLTETTKDLEVAAWMTEALVRSQGLAGLAAGAQVIGGLAERYWDGLFPLPDEDGMETRVSPVTGLNGRDGNGSLMQPLYKLVLFRRQDGTPVAVYQYQQIEKLGTLDARPQPKPRGVRSLGDGSARRRQRCVRGTVRRCQGRARCLAGDGQRDGREGGRRGPFHHGGAGSGDRNHRYCQALRSGRCGGGRRHGGRSGGWRSGG